jgi:hypothetical protein
LALPSAAAKWVCHGATAGTGGRSAECGRASSIVRIHHGELENVRGFVDLKSKYDHGIYRILNENLKFPAWSLAV